jgi:hypothetical protein
MSDRIRSRATISAGIAFVVLAVAGNALQGSTPALHGDAGAVVRFYSDGSTRIAVAMMVSLISVFFLTVFLAAFGSALTKVEGDEGWAGRMASGGGVVTCALLAGGFALNAAGALRAGDGGEVAPDSAVVFYDGGLALSGLAAPIGMAVLLAGSAFVTISTGMLPRWFGWASAVLAVLGIVTPVSFLLMLLFPVWVVAACVVLARHRRQTTDGIASPDYVR